MDYRVGLQIPSKDILRRFKDEDGEFFVEAKGLPDFLFRVDENNQVYYKIERSMLTGEDLTLVEDYTRARTKPVEQSEPVHPIEMQPDLFEETQPPESQSDSITAGVSETLESSGTLEMGKKKITELEEGEQVPPELIPKCKKNDYGGYSLRHNRFLYILDSEYRVDLRTPDAALSYDFGGDTIAADAKPSPGPADTATTRKMDLNAIKAQKEPELKKGDILPPDLRSQAEEALGPGAGSRIQLGSHLYLLDTEYRVTAKMKLSFYDTVSGVIPQPQAPPPKQLSVREVVDNIVNTFDMGLDSYRISADYFRETALSPSNREALVRAYNGDLSQLNDDTREATAQGEETVLNEMGLGIFKAALLHELYIKSTLTGRGDNMKFFITLLMVTQPDGTPGDFKDGITLEQQKEVVNYFGSRRKVYKDKTDIIKRVYRHLRSEVFDEFEELIDAGRELKFNAHLIMKLYQQTNRLDRGNGITMIRLSRDLMEYRPST